MSLQRFVWAKLTGLEQFILERSDHQSGAALAGRCHWVSLLSEILPRALLAESGLAEILVGTSGGGQFLLIVPEESLPALEAIFQHASSGIDTLTGGLLRLLWTSTENLGDWPVVQGRLANQMRALQGTPGAQAAGRGKPDDAYFAELALALRTVESVGWSRETPALVLPTGGQRSYAIGDATGAIPLARHQALTDDATEPARLRDLAQRAQGTKRWGVLRGDVDGFGARLRQSASVEDYVRLSQSLKQFLAGEIRLLAIQGDFFRRVSLLWVGDDDFALYGSWDALVDFAREVHRVFHRFASAQWDPLPGLDGKTISMALAIAPPGANDAGISFRAVYEEAGRLLEAAKNEDRDRFHVLGRALEWKQVERSSDMKATMVRMVREFGCSPDFLRELSGFFGDRLASPGRERTDRPWRYYRRISSALGDPRRSAAAFEKQKAALIRDLIGAGSAHARLRPTGRVAVDWARLHLAV
jgi:CRISPR-associated protein Csm1